MSENPSQQAVSTRRNATSWRPGQSGNPGGRPKGVEELARKHTPEAIAALVSALKRPAQAVPAAIALLDRGWGKPKQTIEGSGDNPLSVIALHLLAAQSISNELLTHPPTIDTSVYTDTNVDTHGLNGSKPNGKLHLSNLLNAPLPEE